MIPRAPFGRTGHDSTRLIFGAVALALMDQEEADRTLEVVRAAGINHIDTAFDYGASEDRLNPWLAEHRDDVFLATKTGERTGAEARAGLERSLERLGVDSVDLFQFHNLVEPDEWETVFAPGGALEAIVQARDEGLVRFIGVTGHGTRIPAMHRRSLERFDFDSVLFPYNFSMLAIPEYRREVEALLATCAERDVAVQTIKSVARRRFAAVPPRSPSWYEPLDDGAAIARAVRYVLAEPRLFLNTTSEPTLVPATIRAAAGDLAKPTDAEMEADVERFGIQPLFDGGRLERIEV